jgi:SAM-dependent methyltransferase
MTSDASPTTPLSDETTSVVRQIWDAAADTYDSQWGHGLKTDLEAKAWSALLSRMFPPDEPITIIDVGCGTGVLCLLLTELGHKVIALDLSEKMLRVCQASADARTLRTPRHAWIKTTVPIVAGRPNATSHTTAASQMAWQADRFRWPLASSSPVAARPGR